MIIPYILLGIGSSCLVMLVLVQFAGFRVAREKTVIDQFQIKLEHAYKVGHNECSKANGLDPLYSRRDMLTPGQIDLKFL